ncbi:Uncharacterised protein [Eikenella corrodens]|nr:Uncharacterised protein [Eikenella corrodens]
MLGFGDKPLKLAEGKVLAGIDNHPAMTAEVWKRLPEWIDKPAMVFDSDTVDGRLVFIAPEKVRGSDVRIVIEPKGDALEAHVLVNAYNKDSKSPYFRWVNDRLLRYADKEKASRIDERFGLRLPDILRNPAFMPDAQIHGMGRGNMKALRRTKILTEKNLQGYLKNNPALSLNHSGNTPSAATPERVAEIWQQVARAVGQRNMRLIDVLTAAEASRPDGAQDLRGVDGWYDPKSNLIGSQGQMMADDHTDFAVEQDCRIGMDTQNIGGRTGGNFQHKKNGAVLSVFSSLICSVLYSYFEGNISANLVQPQTKWRFQVAFAVFTLLMGVFHQERPVVGVLPGQGVGGNV